ncbi:MAG: hypothetical protein LBB49_05880 [Gracilibacteraceae bacterium]|jgi:hypothetical protein|nr:hypothetical protein [Gracilibacteraceae bacterium]
MAQGVYDCPRAYGILSAYSDFVDIKLDEIEMNLCSAMVDAVSRVLGRSHKNLAVLADILMCLYLSDLVHKKIKAMGVDGDEKCGRQYAVLLGDYWLSESFWQLISHCFYAQVSLRHFTKLVKTMKEGALRRWQLAQEQFGREELSLIWEMERGAMMALGGKLAAEILDANAAAATLFEKFGCCLGMAWAAGVETAVDGGTGSVAPAPEDFLAEAKVLADEMACFGDVTALHEILEFLADHLSVRSEMFGF